MFETTLRSSTPLLIVVALLSTACGTDTTHQPGTDGGTTPDSGSDQRFTPNQSITLLNQGDVQLTAGESPDITVDVPKDVVSVTVSIVGKTGERYGICHWKGPDGILVDEGWEDDSSNSPTQCKSCALYMRTHDRVFAIVAPNNPGVAVVPGVHTLSVCGAADFSSSSAKVRVMVFAKTSPQLPMTGTLDLNLHFTGAQGLNAQTAQTDLEFTAALEELQQIYSQVGITIGTLSWSDVDSRHQILELKDDFSDLFGNVFELFAEAAGKNDVGLDVFFVDRFEGLGGFQGWAGGIPGPPLVHGRGGSGVAVALTIQSEINLTLGQIIAHEVGHFLGLFHTDEVIDWLADPLPDTPDEDASYLMHFKPEGSKLSQWQGRIMRSSPWVYH